MIYTVLQGCLLGKSPNIRIFVVNVALKNASSSPAHMKRPNPGGVCGVPQSFSGYGILCQVELLSTLPSIASCFVAKPRGAKEPINVAPPLLEGHQSFAAWF